MTVLPYDRARAAAYARRWALGRNPAYYDFARIGGDCTNFASQCLYAGARVMNYTPTFGWYYISVNNRAPAWTGVEYFYSFLVGNDSVGPFAAEVPREDVQPGDFVQLADETGDYYHTPVIVAVAPQILVAAHDDDAFGRPLNTYLFAQARFLHIEGVRTW
ncbi:MAG: amidase domain-containing protein [Oscillospiraceae bacterium]|nr:amidase domain-containing protein [Oscillospiraceae bacterium]